MTASDRQDFNTFVSGPMSGETTVEVRSLRKGTIWKWVLMGVGAAGVGLGGYMMADGASQAADFEDSQTTNGADL